MDTEQLVKVLSPDAPRVYDIYQLNKVSGLARMVGTPRTG